MAPTRTPRRRLPPPSTSSAGKAKKPRKKLESTFEQRPTAAQQPQAAEQAALQQREVLEAEEGHEDLARELPAQPTDVPVAARMDGQNGNGGAGEGAIRMPPALQNWEAFSQALFGHRPQLPEFYGRDHEDPTNYLERCEEYIEAFNLPERQRVRALEKGLKGEAEKWWLCYKTMGVEWPRYQDLVRSRFDSETIKGNLVAQLYGKKQEEKKSVGPFLQQKYMLYQRVRPTEPEATRVTTLISLLKPSIKRAMRAHNFADFSELLAKALEAERDEEEEQPPAKPKAKKEATEEKTKPPASQKEQSIPKCWHCPEKHWHKDCPVLQNKQSGNWREAAPAPAVPAQNQQSRQ